MITDRVLHIDLDSPIDNGGVKVSQLTVSPPTVGARRKAAGRLRNGENAESFMQFQIDLVAACTSLTAPAIEQLDVDVMSKAWSHIMVFLAPAQETSLS